MLLTECIIAASKIDNDVVLVKNRDRSYFPKIEVVHALINNIEVAIFHDKTTGWGEGINEYGIGIINSALRVGYDEHEKDIVQKSGKKSEDAIRILHTLANKNLKSAIDTAIHYKGGIKGHTILSNVNSGVVIENTSKHSPFIKQINLNTITVRTNHGYKHFDAGYTHGIKYLSSKIRKISAENAIKKVENYHELAKALRRPKYKKHSMLNMARDTKCMSTTSQLVLDLTRKEMLLYYFPSKIESYGGIKNLLPSGYVPKIKIYVYRVKNK